ncbi:hypothetical protein ACEPAI_3036 [Sanghuangporus weigelae]
MPGLLVSSEQASSPARLSKRKSNSGWTFNFRAGFDSDSDSGSSDEGTKESTVPFSARKSTVNENTKRTSGSSGNVIRNTDRESKGTQVNETEDARLLRELDIASRADKDTAKFTTTPWSIARVNAAIRAPVADDFDNFTAALSAPSRPVDSNAVVKRGRSVERVVHGDVIREQELMPAKSLGSAVSFAPAKKTGSTPKLGKTIEKYFATRKLGRDIPRIKPPSHQRIHPGSDPESRHLPPPTQHAPICRPVINPSDRSLYTRSSVDLKPNQLAPAVPTLVSRSTANFSSSPSSGDVSGDSSPFSTQNLLSTSNFTDFPDDSTPKFDSEDTKPLPNDAQADDSLGSDLDQSIMPYSYQQEQLAAPTICADVNYYAGNRQVYDTTPVKRSFSQTSLRVHSEHDLSRPQFSSPLRNELKMEATTEMDDIGCLSDSIPEILGTETHSIPEERTAKYPKQMDPPGYMRSFSSPMKPILQRSSRAALGLNPPRIFSPGSDDYLSQLKRSKSPDPGPFQAWSVAPDLQACLTTATESHRGTLRTEWYPKKDEVDCILSASGPRYGSDRPKCSIPLPASRYEPPLPARRSSPPSRRDLERFRRPIKHDQSPTLGKIDAHPSCAYDDDDDEDANWSTLPQRKKARTQDSSGQLSDARKKSMKQSGRFKLPIALPSLAAKSVISHEPTSAGKKRVITYLPPPPLEDPKQMSDPIPTSQHTYGPAERQTLTKKTPERRTEAVRSSEDIKGMKTKVMRPVLEWSLKRFRYGLGHDAPSKPNRVESSDDKQQIPHHAHTYGSETTKVEGTDDYLRALHSEEAKFSDRGQTNPSPPPNHSHSHSEQETNLASDETDSQTLIDSSSFYTNTKVKPEEDEDEVITEDVTIPFDTASLNDTYPKARRSLLEVRFSIVLCIGMNMSIDERYPKIHSSFIHYSRSITRSISSSAKQHPHPSGTNSVYRAAGCPSKTPTRFPVPTQEEERYSAKLQS